MKNYKVKCHSGCGKVLGTLELPDNIPLTTQDKGYLCDACAKKLSANLVSQPKSLLSPDQARRIQELKDRLGPKKSIGAAELDELVSIILSR